MTPAALRSQGKHTPFSGYELPGRVRCTIAAGQIAFEAGTGPERRMRFAARGAGGWLRALGHALAGWPRILFAFPRLSERSAKRACRPGRCGCWRLLGIRLELRGQPPAAGPVLLVANHISWLDILVMHAARHCRFVSKSDVRHWPLIGTLATGAGTLYIERESRRDAMRVVHHMADSLKRGRRRWRCFPEGTTSDGVGPAAVPRQPDPGRDLRRRAGAARGAALHRHARPARTSLAPLLHR